MSSPVSSHRLLEGLERPVSLRTIPDPATEPTIDARRAAAVIGVSVRTAYAACESGQWPAIRVGRAVRIPTARWLRAVGLTEEAA